MTTGGLFFILQDSVLDIPGQETTSTKISHNNEFVQKVNWTGNVTYDVPRSVPVPLGHVDRRPSSSPVHVPRDVYA